MHFITTVFLALCAFIVSAQELTTLEKLVKELGLPGSVSLTEDGHEITLPTEIQITKKAQALFALQALEKELPMPDVAYVCARTKGIAGTSPERLKRLEPFRERQAIPLADCEKEFPAVDRECQEIFSDFFVEHHISGSIKKPAVQKTLVFIMGACRPMKMQGYRIDTDHILKNHEKQLNNE